MKTTMKILPLLFGVMLFFTQCEKEAEIDGSVNAEAFMTLKAGEVECNFAEQILWAGAGRNNTDNGTDVGTVTATIVGNMLYVVYDVIDEWHAVEYHLWVGNSIGDIPKNAAPGLFPYSGFASYEIDLDELGFEIGDDIFIAAHAVVREGGLKALEALLPETAKFSIVLNQIETYLTTTVTEGDMLDGVYGSYCIDSGTFITPGTVYDANVYSSYALTGFDKVDKPENFPMVNWIINYIEVGDEYSYADVQRAIWELLENEPVDIANPPLPYDLDKVAEIIAAAEAYEEDTYEEFVPGCGQYLVIVLDPVGPVELLPVQPVIIWIPIPCGGDETAWAFGGYTFIKEKIARKWGWIFELTYCEP